MSISTKKPTGNLLGTVESIDQYGKYCHLINKMKIVLVTQSCLTLCNPMDCSPHCILLMLFIIKVFQILFLDCSLRESRIYTHMYIQYIYFYVFILYATTQLILSLSSNGSFSWLLSIFYMQYILSQIEKVLLLSNAVKIIIYYILTLNEITECNKSRCKNLYIDFSVLSNLFSLMDFPGGTVVNTLPVKAGDMDSVPGLEDPLE